MPHEIIRDKDRGHLEHGWLKTAHSFSFGRYVNRTRMNFGALLVLNEDTIVPAQGFAEHFHDNMEIVTIPLSGSLKHGDSMGNGSVVKAGDVQIMSAGTGIMHSEANPSETEPCHLLQIWVIPNERGLPTRYEQKTFETEPFMEKFHTMVSPDGSDGSLKIHQDAWFRAGLFSVEKDVEIAQHDKKHGTYLFVISGKLMIGDETVQTGDAFSFWGEESIKMKILEPSHLITIEVPMEF